MYFLYDSRYTDNPDRAIVYCAADTLEEAKEDKKEYFPDAVIVKYEEVNNELTNPEIIYCL